MVGVRVTVALDDVVGVEVETVPVITVVTWLAELLALFGSNSWLETNASLSRLPVACGMVATTVTRAVAPGAIDPNAQTKLFIPSGTPQVP